jgi:ABC-type multidrug transport system fused ATPase/permease subunit
MIWAALKDSHIEEYIKKDPLGLESIVEEGGKNFSVGQRQLLSLSRAILRNCPLVLCDEVTASIDYQTDKLIQETIRVSPSLRNSTIVTVAHRLRTIADSDMIVVIQAGSIGEIGAPYDLLCRNDSLFKSLAFESNEFEDIKMIAKSKKAE